MNLTVTVRLFSHHFSNNRTVSLLVLLQSVYIAYMSSASAGLCETRRTQVTCKVLVILCMLLHMFPKCLPIFEVFRTILTPTIVFRVPRNYRVEDAASN